MCVCMYAYVTLFETTVSPFIEHHQVGHSESVSTNIFSRLLLAKKERGLRKGNGYHYDLLLMGLLALLCSLLGLPWMCAAAVQSLAHANSLTVMKRHAPGERPQVDHVIEQRVTTIGVALLVGELKPEVIGLTGMESYISVTHWCPSTLLEVGYVCSRYITAIVRGAE